MSRKKLLVISTLEELSLAECSRTSPNAQPAICRFSTVSPFPGSEIITHDDASDAFAGLDSSIIGLGYDWLPYEEMRTPPAAATSTRNGSSSQKLLLSRRS